MNEAEKYSQWLSKTAEDCLAKLVKENDPRIIAEAIEKGRQPLVKLAGKNATRIIDLDRKLEVAKALKQIVTNLDEIGRCDVETAKVALWDLAQVAPSVLKRAQEVGL